MAFDIKTIATLAGPSADVNKDGNAINFYALTYFEVSAPGEQHGQPIEDLPAETSSTNINSVGAGVDNHLKIAGDIKGDGRRKITYDGSGGGWIKLQDGDTDDFTLEDISVEKTGGKDEVCIDGISMSEDGFGIAIKNVIMIGWDKGVFIAAGFSANNTLLENVLFLSCNRGLHYIQNVAGTLITGKNCGAAKCTTSGFEVGTSVNTNFKLFNCWGMNKDAGGKDFENNASSAGTREINDGISSDDSATNGSWTSTTGSVINKNATGAYFIDFTNNDVHLTDTANALWGVTPDSANTPAVDLDNVTRTGDDSGPFENVSAGLSIPVAIHNYRRRRVA